MECHYSMEGQALRRLVDADIVNRKRERAVDTGEVQAEGVKHETATRSTRWTPGPTTSESRHLIVPRWTHLQFNATVPGTVREQGGGLGHQHRRSAPKA